MSIEVILFLLVPLIIGAMGEAAKKLILGTVKPSKEGYKGWRGVYVVTLRLHAVIVGALIGLVGHSFEIPTPDYFGTSLGGVVLAYACAGVIAAFAYDMLVKVPRNLIGFFSRQFDNNGPSY